MASRARNRRRFKSSTSRLTLQSYAIKPTATPILSAALWLRRPLGGRKASRTLPSSLPAARAELARTEEARDRYFRAFEAGTMSAQDCAERVRSLAQRIDELRGRASEDWSDEFSSVTLRVSGHDWTTWGKR